MRVCIPISSWLAQTQNLLSVDETRADVRVVVVVVVVVVFASGSSIYLFDVFFVSSFICWMFDYVFVFSL